MLVIGRPRHEAGRRLHAAGDPGRPGAAGLAAGWGVLGNRQRQPQRACGYRRDRTGGPDAFGPAVPAPRAGAERGRADRPHRSRRTDLLPGQRARNALCRAVARIPRKTRAATAAIATGRRRARRIAPGAAVGLVAAGWPATAAAG